MLTDAGGAPLVVQTVPANQHDVTTLLPLVVEHACRGRANPGVQNANPTRCVADKAFDCQSLREHLALARASNRCCPNAAKTKHGLGVRRWFVERTISWLHQFRRLRIRWDRRPEIHQAFLSLAAAVICYRIWINKT